jgi:hypothetical protein
LQDLSLAEVLFLAVERPPGHHASFGLRAHKVSVVARTIVGGLGHRRDPSEATYGSALPPRWYTAKEISSPSGVSRVCRKIRHLDPDPEGKSGNPLFSEVSVANFFATCHVDVAGQPANLTGVDISTAEVHEKGHESRDERIAETVNIVKVTVLFDRGVPTTREMQGVERVPTGEFSGQSR